MKKMIINNNNCLSMPYDPPITHPPLAEDMMIHIKYIGYNKLLENVYKHNGIVYGGFVRDRFISDHFANLYICQNEKECLDCKQEKKFTNCRNCDANFWDKNHKPETNQRLLLPDDIDICFYNECEVDRFVNSLRNVTEFHKIFDDHLFDSNYISQGVKKIRQISICITVGNIPFISKGTNIILYADIVIPLDNKLEPPFNCLDMLCNGFIMKKNIVRISNNTGTFIDKQGMYKRQIISDEIIQDLQQFKTRLCFKSNLMAATRIQNMISKKLNWTFTNLPFKCERYVENNENNENEECSICREVFDADSHVAYTVYGTSGSEIQSPKMHYECLLKYLRYQEINTNNKSFVFKCPMRNNIDFTKCDLNI